MAPAGDNTGSRGHPSPRFVWVDMTGRWGSPDPGILLDWRKHRGRWQALVVSATGGGMTTARCSVQWVDAGHVRPAEARLSRQK